MNEGTSCIAPTQPETPALSSIHEDTSGTLASSEPSTTSVSHLEPSGTAADLEPSATFGTPVSKKKCKRPSKLSKAEASARNLIHDIVEGQKKAKRCREDMKEHRLQSATPLRPGIQSSNLTSGPHL